jgi:hypothetical protein
VTSPVGRPTKYRPEMGEVIRRELAKGHSIEGSAPVIGVCSDTVYEYIKKYPDFSDSIKVGLNEGLRYLEQLMQAHMSGKEIKGFKSNKSNLNAIIFTLKTRFHKIYSEKNLIEQTSKVEITIDGDESKL